MRTILAAMLFLLHACACRAGDLAGAVNVLRTVTDARPISPFAQPRHAGPTEHVDHSGTEPVLAVVYLEAHDNLNVGPVPEPNPVVDQVDMTIVPHTLVVPVGTTVDFNNSDEVYHNLFSLSPARKFDLGRYGKGGSRSITFEEPGEVRLFCDIHPHMSGIVLILPNQYFDEVPPDGRYRIEGIPAGDYRVHAWHETLDEQIKTVSIPAEGEVELNFYLGER
ncbi:hypothetical protein GF324_03740 [bacterium]|nr:hypothetical protein [bacterium]